MDEKAENSERQVLLATNGGNSTPNYSSVYGGIPTLASESSEKKLSTPTFTDRSQQQLLTSRTENEYGRQTTMMNPEPESSGQDANESYPADEKRPRTRSISERFHCHVGATRSDDALSGSGGAERAGNQRAVRVLWFSIIVCLLFMICEVVGGIWAQSLAIITDSAHLLADLASMMISLFSLYLAVRPASQRMSFGWYRAEVVGAFVSVFLIWVVTGILVYLAIDRIISQTYDIDAPIMAITAAIGVCVNLVMGSLLYFGGHSHSHLGSGSHSHSGGEVPPRRTANARSNGSATFSGDDDREALLGNDGGGGGHSHFNANINIRAAFIHVLGDLIQSVGVLLAALLILWKESLAIMDPICTLIFSVIIVCTTVYIIRDALVVLLEGRPSNIDFRHVFHALECIDGVIKVHDLRIWALTTDKVAISVHLEIAPETPAQTVLKNTTVMLRREFNVYESTVQIEGYRPESVNCFQCIVPSR